MRQKRQTALRFTLRGRGAGHPVRRRVGRRARRSVRAGVGTGGAETATRQATAMATTAATNTLTTEALANPLAIHRGSPSQCAKLPPPIIAAPSPGRRGRLTPGTSCAPAYRAGHQPLAPPDWHGFGIRTACLAAFRRSITARCTAPVPDPAHCAGLDFGGRPTVSPETGCRLPARRQYPR